MHDQIHSANSAMAVKDPPGTSLQVFQLLKLSVKCTGGDCFSLSKQCRRVAAVGPCHPFLPSVYIFQQNGWNFPSLQEPQKKQYFRPDGSLLLNKSCVNLVDLNANSQWALFPEVQGGFAVGGESGLAETGPVNNDQPKKWMSLFWGSWKGMELLSHSVIS